MLTPTPVPSNQIVQAVQASQNIIDNAVQQGIVGVLLLIGIAAVLYTATQLIRVYFQRNSKPDTAGTYDAIKAMAEMTTRSDEREERQQEERRLERAEWRQQIADRDNKFTEAIVHLGDGYNRIGDVLVRQESRQEALEIKRNSEIVTIAAMKDDIGQMVSMGSVPLRGLIETVARIEITLAEIKGNLLPCADIMGILDSHKQMYQDGLEAFKTDIELFTRNIQSRIEERRKSDTGEVKVITTVEVQEPMPQ